MKIKYVSILLVAIVLVIACNNAKKEKDTNIEPAGGDVADTGTGRMGDTASYDRMPQHLADSMRK